MGENLKFKKSESFYIRDGWFEKALNTIATNETNIFSKNQGVKYLGIGSNMVKGLKYWLQASKIIDSKCNLTEFGNLIFKYDKYFEESFTWFLVHYFLVTNKIECPLFYTFFDTPIKTFNKNLLTKFFYSELSNNTSDLNKGYIEADTNILLKSYVYEGVIENPEDNYVCPLSMLKLLQREGDTLKKCNPIYSKLSYLIIFYCLEKLYEEDFKIEDAINHELSPLLIFNIDKNTFLQYLDEMRNNKLISISKTAGLNIVHFNTRKGLDQIFKDYFEGEKYVL